MSGSKTDFVLLVCFVLFCWILAGLFLKPLYALWKRRNEYWFANRHPSATWLLIAALFLSAVICRPLYVYKEYMQQNDDTENAARIIGFVSQALNVPVFYGAIIVYCTRYWLIYFDFQMAVRCSDQRWKELLLTAPETDCQHAFDWFTAHKQTLGSWNYIKRIDAAIISVLFCTIVSLHLVAYGLVPLLQVLVLVSALVFLFAVTVKMPRFFDTIKARVEYELHAKVFAFFFVVYSTFVVLAFFKKSFLISVLRQTNNVLSYFCFLYALLLWLPRQFELPSVSRMPQLSAEHIVTDGRLLLSQIISQTDGFRVFMEHLFSEFSYENLLCCVELLQFRQLHRAAIGEENGDEELKRVAVATKSETQPQRQRVSIAFTSSATFKRQLEETPNRVDRFQIPQQMMELSPTISTNDSVTWRRRFQQLYHKYISPSASMPVNLSFRTRQRLTTVAEELGAATGNVAIGCNVFDDAIVELRWIMNDSYSRFVLTDSYKLFVEHL